MRLWLACFAREELPSTEFEAILHEDLTELRVAGRKEDARIETFAAGVDKEFHDGAKLYTNNEDRVL